MPREGAPEAVPRGSASGKRSRGSASRQRLVEASPEAVPRGSASGRRWSNKAPGFQKSPSPVQQSPLVILGCTPEWRKGHPPQTEWSNRALLSFWGAPQNGGMVQQSPLVQQSSSLNAKMGHQTARMGHQTARMGHQTAKMEHQTAKMEQFVGPQRKCPQFVGPQASGALASRLAYIYKSWPLALNPNDSDSGFGSHT